MPLLQLGYTPDGLLYYVYDANSNLTYFVPDWFDRLNSIIYPDNTRDVFGYDADGNVTAHQMRAGSSQTIFFYYDTLNRVVYKQPSPSMLVS